MKKETALKKLANHKASIDTAVQNIRDLLYDIDENGGDGDLSVAADDWVEAIEEFFDGDGSTNSLTEKLEDFYNSGEDED